MSFSISKKKALDKKAFSEVETAINTKFDQAEEESLAGQLKQICSQKGQELNPTKSAEIFHKLAKVYEKRRPEVVTDRMICLIKSAALFNAAIARKPDNMQEIKNDLKDFCTNILREANAYQKHANLLERTNSVAKAIATMRKEVKEQLRKLQKIPDNIEPNEQESLENRKAAVAEQQLNFLTNKYKNIMADIAQYVKEVMGKPPCEFSLAGMGSLARKEITPYSDFENMILLETRIDNKYKEMLNYFRWYSVIFQIILINLQETIIPSVSIDSLNNEKSKFGDWFFDGVTTRGICFDGMMPHACKFPLGRQQLTSKKPWKTELIKPVNEMLKYLNSEESLKNGYHLGTILTKTCYVYGDVTIFDKFEKGVFELIKKEKHENIEESVKSQITEDLEKFAIRQSLYKIKPTQQFNVKQVLYRSTTILIAEFGRLYKVSANSCFEILRDLADNKHVFTENAKNKLMFAVALACEIRLRWYMMNERQNDNISLLDILKLVGKKATIRYFQIAYALQCDISKRLNLKKVHLYSEPDLLNVSLTHCFNDQFQMKEVLQVVKHRKGSNQRYYDFDECLSSITKEFPQLYQKNTKTERENSNQIAWNITKMQEVGNVLYGLQFYDDASECFQNCLDMLGLSESCFQETKININIFSQLKLNLITDRELAFLIHRTACCLLEVSKFQKAFIYFNFSLIIKKKILSITANPTARGNADLDLANTYQKLGTCLLEVNKFQEALKYLENALKIKSEVVQYASADRELAEALYEVGRCSYFNGSYQNAKKNTERLLEIQKNISIDGETDLRIANSALLLSACLSQLNEKSKAEEFLNQAQQICASAMFQKVKLSNVANTLRWLGISFLDMQKRTDDALLALNKSLNFTKSMSLDSSTDRKIAYIWYDIGRCYLKSKKPQNAKSCFEKALKIVTNTASKSAIADESVAILLLNIGKCFMGLTKHEKAKLKFETALKIFEKKLSKRETAITNNWIGRSLVKKKKLLEASVYFEKELQIYENLSQDVATDRDIAGSSNWIGRCLIEINKPNEAKISFEKTLQIYEKLSQDVSIDHDVACTSTWIGRCLIDMKKPDEAKIFFEKTLVIYEKSSQDILKDHDVARTSTWIGRCFIDMKNFRDAKAFFEKSLRIYEKSSQAVTIDRFIADTCNWIGHCLIDMKKPKDAIANFEKALEIYGHVSHDITTDRNVASIHSSIGTCLLNMNKPQEAKLFLELALEAYEQSSVDAKTDRDVALSYSTFGNYFYSIKNVEVAKIFFSKSCEVFENLKADIATDSSYAITRNNLKKCVEKELLKKLTQKWNAIPFSSSTQSI